MTAVSKNLLTALFAVVFIISPVMAADNVGQEFEDSIYWLSKPAWEDRPSYAEDITIQYSATNLIQKRETREVCTSYINTTLVNGTKVETCDSYENETFTGENMPIFNITGDSNAYLGDGHVRTNLTIRLNELSTNTLKETTSLMSEDEYINWFNQNYYYNGSNITSSDVDKLQQKVRDMSARGENTNLQASRINSLEIHSLDPFRASANTTMVFRFNDFRSGSIILSDLIEVKVESNIAN